MMPPFTCQIVAVHDGDGPLRCATGQRIRVAGIQAPDFEDAEPCRTHRAGYVCSNSAARRSQRIVERLVLRQRLVCQPVGASWKRVVARCSFADGRDLACEIVRAGAAEWWPVYVRRYRLRGCGL